MADPEPATAAAVRAQALRIVGRVLRHGASSSVELERLHMDELRDRALVNELVLGVLRRRDALDEELRDRSKRPLEKLDPIVHDGLRLGLYQLRYLDRIPAYAAVAETVEAVKRRAGRFAAGYVNGVLRAAMRDPGVPELTPSLPPFLLGRWQARLGAAAVAEMATAASRPSAMSLRVLTERTSIEHAIERLAAAGVTVRAGRYSPEILTVVEGNPLRADLLSAGVAVVQDEGAAMVAQLVSVRPGQRVLDLCAAPGGKSIAIADRVPGAEVVACDVSPQRLVRLRANLASTGSTRVRVVLADGAAPPFGAIFDHVLVDAPCTGTGTIRRKPEIRYRVDAARLERSAARGLSLAHAALTTMRPHARLVYATCSLEPEENDDVIRRLLTDVPELRLVDPAPLLAPAARSLVGADRVFRTESLRLEIDGFTAFVLEKTT